MEIMPKVHLVPDVIANPYLIVESNGLTLIDTGLPGSQKKILRYISDRGYSAKDLKRIIITHSDMDHVGGLAPLQRVSGARVYSSAVEAEAIAKGVSSRPLRAMKLRRRILFTLLGRFFRPAPVRVDEIITDGQTLDVLGGLQVLATPGHTPGHVSLYSPSTGILFVGDSIVSHDAGLVGSVPANTWNQDQAAASVKKQAALRPRVVCSGHGPVVMDAMDKMPVA